MNKDEEWDEERMRRKRLVATTIHSHKRFERRDDTARANGIPPAQGSGSGMEGGWPMKTEWPGVVAYNVGCFAFLISIVVGIVLVILNQGC